MKQAYNFFEQAHKKNRLSHLYLIYGEKGSGKMRLAQDVAHLILKQNDAFDEVIKSQIDGHKSPNVMIIEPDGQSIKKEQIIALQQEFSKTSLVKGARIYIISHIDKMTQSAANSLLKFMEEPANQHIYGLLLTENKDRVISTILSRSQIIGLKSMDAETLKDALVLEQVDANMASFIPYLTKNIDEAIQMSSDPNYIELMHFMQDFAKVWIQKKQSLILFFMRNSKLLTYDREFFKSFLEVLLIFYLDLIYYKTHQPIVLDFLKEEIQQASAIMTIDHIESITTYIKEHLKRQNYYINLELALDDLAYALDKSR